MKNNKLEIISNLFENEKSTPKLIYKSIIRLISVFLLKTEIQNKIHIFKIT